MTSQSSGRPYQLKVRMSFAEREAYLSASAASGLEVSSWVRDCLNDAVQQKRWLS